MNMEWIAKKSTSLTAGAIGIGFLIVGYVDSRHRYFHLCAAIIAFVYAYRQFRKRDTPFEKHEREIRRKVL